jgi:hypothetical protein
VHGQCVRKNDVKAVAVCRSERRHCGGQGRCEDGVDLHRHDAFDLSKKSKGE